MYNDVNDDVVVQQEIGECDGADRKIAHGKPSISNVTASDGAGSFAKGARRGEHSREGLTVDEGNLEKGKGRQGKGKGKGKGRSGKGFDKGQSGRGFEKGSSGKGFEKGRSEKGYGKGRDGKGRDGKGKGRDGKGRDGKGRDGKGRMKGFEDRDFEKGKGCDTKGKGRDGKGKGQSKSRGKGRYGKDEYHFDGEGPGTLDGDKGKGKSPSNGIFGFRFGKGEHEESGFEKGEFGFEKGYKKGGSEGYGQEKGGKKGRVPGMFAHLEAAPPPKMNDSYPSYGKGGSKKGQLRNDVSSSSFTGPAFGKPDGRLSHGSKGATPLTAKNPDIMSFFPGNPGALDRGFSGVGAGAPDRGFSGVGAGAPDRGFSGVGAGAPDRGFSGMGAGAPDRGFSGAGAGAPDRGFSGVGAGAPGKPYEPRAQNQGKGDWGQGNVQIWNHEEPPRNGTYPRKGEFQNPFVQGQFAQNPRGDGYLGKGSSPTNDSYYNDVQLPFTGFDKQDDMMLTQQLMMPQMMQMGDTQASMGSQMQMINPQSSGVMYPYNNVMQGRQLSQFPS